MARLAYIVEPNAQDRQGLTMCLGDHGFDMRSFAQGGDALFALEHGHADLVVVTAQLKDMPVFTFLEQLRKRHPHAPVLLTGLTTLEEACRAVDLGAVGLYPKPINLRRLLERVQALARQPVEVPSSTQVSTVTPPLGASPPRAVAPPAAAPPPAYAPPPLPPPPAAKTGPQNHFIAPQAVAPPRAAPAAGGYAPPPLPAGPAAGAPPPPVVPVGPTPASLREDLLRLSRFKKVLLLTGGADSDFAGAIDLICEDSAALNEYFLLFEPLDLTEDNILNVIVESSYSEQPLLLTFTGLEQTSPEKQKLLYNLLRGKPPFNFPQARFRIICCAVGGIEHRVNAGDFNEMLFFELSLATYALPSGVPVG